MGALAAAALTAVAALPASAAAHGPVDPVATSYLARISGIPAGLDARIVDGYLRVWLRVPATETVVVLDYSGAPYLRFSRAGVEVNERSAMYYFNQTPAETPPATDLALRGRPIWHRLSAGHNYEWLDGRPQALAAVALPPGRSFVGPWRIPLLVDGRAGSISGGLWHAGAPSIVWFWPILVLLACMLAAWRLRRLEWDARLAQALALASLAAIAAAGVARELHGRPGVSTGQWAQMVLVAAFVGWGARHVAFREPGYLGYFAIGSVALWEGLHLLPTLLHGYVLTALPAFPVRVSAVLCLGCGIGLFWPAFRLALERQDRPRTAGVHARRRP